MVKEQLLNNHSPKTKETDPSTRVGFIFKILNFVCSDTLIMDIYVYLFVRRVSNGLSLSVNRVPKIR